MWNRKGTFALQKRHVSTIFTSREGKKEIQRARKRKALVREGATYTCPLSLAQSSYSCRKRRSLPRQKGSVTETHIGASWRGVVRPCTGARCSAPWNQHNTRAEFQSKYAKGYSSGTNVPFGQIENGNIYHARLCRDSQRRVLHVTDDRRRGKKRKQALALFMTRKGALAEAKAAAENYFCARTSPFPSFQSHRVKRTSIALL